MSKTKNKAVEVLQHQDGGGQQIVLPGFELSKNDSIMNFSPAQGSIAAMLPRSRENALTTAQLCRITGKKAREITKAICTERRAGAPILSDPAVGFWLAGDAKEARACAAALHRRAAQIHKTARALERCVKGDDNDER